MSFEGAVVSSRNPGGGLLVEPEGRDALQSSSRKGRRTKNVELEGGDPGISESVAVTWLGHYRPQCSITFTIKVPESHQVTRRLLISVPQTHLFLGEELHLITHIIQHLAYSRINHFLFYSDFGKYSLISLF